VAFVVRVCCDKQTPSLTAITYAYSTLDAAVIDRKARYWPKIEIIAPVRGPRQNIAITFGIEKLEWYGYPIMKKV